jgi:hypothetical protein
MTEEEAKAAKAAEDAAKAAKAAEEAKTRATTKPADGAKSYTQKEVDEIMVSVRATYEDPDKGKLTKAERELAAIKEAAKTDDEKKADQLRTEGRSKAEEEFKTKERQWSIERAVLQSGIPEGVELEDVVALVRSRMERTKSDDAAAAVKSLRETSPQLFGATKKTPGGGGGRNADTTTVWTDDAVRKSIQDGTYAENEAEIAKARRGNIQTAIAGGIHRFQKQK